MDFLIDQRELDGIALNLALAVMDGEYSIAECLFEVMPFEYSLSLVERRYVHELVELLSGQRVEEDLEYGT